MFRNVCELVVVVFCHNGLWGFHLVGSNHQHWRYLLANPCLLECEFFAHYRNLKEVHACVEFVYTVHVCLCTVPEQKSCFTYEPRRSVFMHEFVYMCLSVYCYWTEEDNEQSLQVTMCSSTACLTVRSAPSANYPTPACA